MANNSFYCYCDQSASQCACDENHTFYAEAIAKSFNKHPIDEWDNGKAITKMFDKNILKRSKIQKIYEKPHETYTERFAREHGVPYDTYIEELIKREAEWMRRENFFINQWIRQEALREENAMLLRKQEEWAEKIDREFINNHYRHLAQSLRAQEKCREDDENKRLMKAQEEWAERVEKERVGKERKEREEDPDEYIFQKILEMRRGDYFSDNRLLTPAQNKVKFYQNCKKIADDYLEGKLLKEINKAIVNELDYFIIENEKKYVVKYAIHKLAEKGYTIIEDIRRDNLVEPQFRRHIPIRMGYIAKMNLY